MAAHLGQSSAMAAHPWTELRHVGVLGAILFDEFPGATYARFCRTLLCKVNNVNSWFGAISNTILYRYLMLYDINIMIRHAGYIMMNSLRRKLFRRDLNYLEEIWIIWKKWRWVDVFSNWKSFFCHNEKATAAIFSTIFYQFDYNLTTTVNFDLITISQQN